MYFILFCSLSVTFNGNISYKLRYHLKYNMLKFHLKIFKISFFTWSYILHRLIQFLCLWIFLTLLYSFINRETKTRYHNNKNKDTKKMKDLLKNGETINLFRQNKKKEFFFFLTLVNSFWPLCLKPRNIFFDYNFVLTIKIFRYNENYRMRWVR